MSSKNHVEKYKSCGYVLCYAPWHKKANKHGYVYEHRLVMEAAIGRYLYDDEVVHHKDFNRSNNELSNLEILSIKEHHRLHGIEVARKHGLMLQDRSPCPFCGHRKSPGSKTCASCSSKMNRLLLSLQSNSDNPCTKTTAQEQLSSLLQSKTIAQVASLFNVSRTTISRAIKKLEISYISKRHLCKGNVDNFRNPQVRERCRLAIKEYYKTHRRDTAIPVGCYDKEGNLVKTYDAISDVKEDGYSSSCVLRVVNGERRSHKKLYWRKLET